MSSFGPCPTKLKAILFLGSVMENRIGLRVANFMQNKMEAHGYEVDFWDPAELKFEVLRKPVHFYGRDRTGCPPWLLNCEGRIRGADAYVVVSPEYNHCVPPALINMLDHFPPSAFAYKPSAITCYSPGPFGGMRAGMSLRPMLAELGCSSIPHIVGIPEAHKAIDECGQVSNTMVDESADKLLNQLTWMAEAMKKQRETVGVPQ